MFSWVTLLPVVRQGIFLGYETSPMRNRHKTALVAMADTKQESRSRLHDFHESKAKTVRRILPDTVKSNMPLTFEGVRFNQSCVNLFPNCQYVTICIDRENLRLFIQPMWEHDKDGLQFANVKNGRNVPRGCTTRIFCQKLFDLMKWNPKTKYRISAIYKEFGDKKIITFNLDEARQVRS